MTKDNYLIINHKIVFINDFERDAAEIRLKLDERNPRLDSEDRRATEIIAKAKPVKELAEKIITFFLKDPGIFIEDGKLFIDYEEATDLTEAEILYLLALRGEAGNEKS